MASAPTLDLNNVSLSDIPNILPHLSLAEQEQLLAELDKLSELKRQKLAQERFLKFVSEVWPTFIGGRDRKSTRLNSSH